MKFNLKKILLFGFLLRLLLLLTPAHVDILNHVDWGIRFWQYGPRDFYEQIFWGVSWPNQPLGSMLLFALIAKLNFWLFDWLWRLNLAFPAFPSFIFPFLEKNLHSILLKVPFALADLGLGYLIYQIVKDLVKKEKPALLASGLFLFNPALIYNSTIWGQTDSLINLLALLGLWLFWQKKYLGGIFFFCLSLYFKFSLIIFLPLFLLMAWEKRNEWLKVLVYLGVVLGFFLLVSLPFVHHGNVVTWIIYLYANRVLPRQGEMLSGNAFNLWTLFYGVDFSLNENLLVLALKAKTWGQSLFLSLTGGLTAWWFFKKKVFSQKKGVAFETYLKLGVVYAMAAFLLLTNMHERYLYPVLPLMAILSAFDKKWKKIFIPLSFVYLLNLYHLWWYPRIEFLVNLFAYLNHLLPRLLSLINLGLLLVIIKLVFHDEKKLAKN